MGGRDISWGVTDVGGVRFSLSFLAYASSSLCRFFWLLGRFRRATRFVVDLVFLGIPKSSSPFPVALAALLVDLKGEGMNLCFAGDRAVGVLSPDLAGDRGAASAWFWISPRAFGRSKLGKAISCWSECCGMMTERGLGSEGFIEGPSGLLRRPMKDARTLDLDRWWWCG